MAKNFSSATGPIQFKPTNDILFRMLWQRNNEVLKAFIASILGMPRESIRSVHIENIVELGPDFDAKTFYLDTLVTFNDGAQMNIEMQVQNKGNWPERSTGYLARTYDSLNKGEDYIKTKPTYQVGILGFTLFPEHPKFFATYSLMDIETKEIFNDKFVLFVLDLKQIDIATETDKQHGRDIWARLFRATTWEELHMIANIDPIYESAANTIYELNQDRFVRDAIIAYEARERHIKETIAEKDETIAKKDATIAEMGSTIAQKDAVIAEKDAIIATLMQEHKP